MVQFEPNHATRPTPDHSTFHSHAPLSRSMRALHAVTPLIESVAAGGRLGCAVHLKLENTQPSGSYKLRGMGYKGRRAVERGATHFVASSGGNAGLAVAWAARALGVQATVVVPSSTPDMARQAIESFGATARVHGDVYAEADGLARELAAADGCEYFSAYDDPELWAGHATMVEEMQEQLGGVVPSAVVLSVGGGGLLCGVVEGLHRVGWQDVPGDRDPCHFFALGCVFTPTALCSSRGGGDGWRQLLPPGAGS